MRKFPSYTALFLLATVGLVVYMAATIWSFEHMGEMPNWLGQTLGILRLVALALMCLAPFLMLLKFFRRLDNNS